MRARAVFYHSIGHLAPDTVKKGLVHTEALRDTSPYHFYLADKSSALQLWVTGAYRRLHKADCL